MSRYTDLLEDPEAEDKARALQNPWTPDEKEMFVKKLALLGKNFRKIASCIDGKTTADCVQFYYLNKKSGLFAWRKDEIKATVRPVVKDGGAASSSSKSRGERKHEKKRAAAAELSGSEGGKRKRAQTEKVKQFIEAEKRSCSGKMGIRRVKIKFRSRCFAPTHAGSGSGSGTAAGLVL